jgi:hypothetical protein
MIINDFKDVLVSTNINQDIPYEDDIFGQFIGKWNFDLKIFDPNEKVIELEGSWIFERILKGNCIQDIWMVPLQNSKKNENNFYEYGTSIRHYNPKTRKWKVTWIGPIQNQYFIFDVEYKNNEIHLKLINHDNLKMRWVFYDMGEKTFQWKSEMFLINKCKWFTNCHMTLTKA